MEKMEYIKIPLHGKNGAGKFTTVDGDYDGEYFSQYRWYVDESGYAKRSVYIDTPDGKRKRLYSYLHHEVIKAPKGMVRDHIDGDKLNNRSCNLRVVTYSDNSKNRDNSRLVRANKSRAGRQSGVKGSTGYYGVSVINNKTRLYLVRVSGKDYGRFEDVVEAAKKYDEVARGVFGGSALLNFP